MDEYTRVATRISYLGVKQFALTVLAGALGFALAWGAWTLVTDHALLQTLASIESQRQAATRAPLMPAPEGRR